MNPLSDSFRVFFCVGVKKCNLPRQQAVIIDQNSTSKCTFTSYNFKLPFVWESPVKMLVGLMKSRWNAEESTSSCMFSDACFMHFFNAGFNLPVVRVASNLDGNLPPSSRCNLARWQYWGGGLPWPSFQDCMPCQQCIWRAQLLGPEEPQEKRKKQSSKCSTFETERGYLPIEEHKETRGS